jgi:NAD-dependent deacetylase
MNELLDHLRADDAYPVFLTGAGISVASGIPTFRGSDPDAVWANDVLEMGTVDFFHRNPVKQWQWYLKRFDGCRSAEPNPAHYALADIEAQVLESGAGSMTITQNVDGLHLKAGTQNLIEIHGSARKMRCSNRYCVNGEPKGVLDWDDALFDPFRADPKMATVPRCPQCNKFIRAHVLWFDERYDAHDDYGMIHLFELVNAMTVLVFIGTSFSVGITSVAVSEAALRGVPMYVIDPHMETPPNHLMTLIREASEEFLPALADSLRS